MQEPAEQREMGGSTVGDVRVVRDLKTAVATITVTRPPNNFLTTNLVRELADVLEGLAGEGGIHAAVVASEGKHFCAGRDFATPRAEGDEAVDLYGEAVRLITSDLPWIAAIQGAAIGGGLGLALAADFRVALPRARFSANFSRLGLHHGFGLTVMLPRLVGHQMASRLLVTSERIDGRRAAEIGLIDELVRVDDGGSEQVVDLEDERPLLMAAAHELAAEIAEAAPLAVREIRATMRADLAERFMASTRAEAGKQLRLRATADFAEGVAATKERRRARFTGR